MSSPARAPILVAPAAFRGTLRASQVAAALGRGLEAGGWPVDLCPLADGGAGTLDVLLPALGGETAAVRVGGRDVGIGLIEDGSTALVELASVLDDGAGASSAAAGELIVAAATETGAAVVIAGAGDVVAGDGGAGAARVLAAAGELPAAVVVLCDVRTAFDRVAASLHGAGELPGDAADALGARLAALAHELPRDPRGVAWSGAGGGLAGALWATGAKLENGAAFVLDALGTDARMRAARAVVVGEGRLDLATLAGKAPGELATRARQSGVPCFAVVANRTLDPFGGRILDLQAILEAGDVATLEAAGRELAAIV